MLIECLKTIPDHRDPQGREFQLWEVVLVSIVAVLSGAQGYTAIARYAEANLDKLKQYFGIKWKRVLHFSAIRKVLIKMDLQALEAALRKHAMALEQSHSTMGKRYIAFDGKALNGSFSSTKDQRASYVFQAFSTSQKLILALDDIGSKENEIAYFQKMIEELDLKGVVITADAMHCQKKHLS